jgi:hypothetical protein
MLDFGRDRRPIRMMPMDGISVRRAALGVARAKAPLRLARPSQEPLMPSIGIDGSRRLRTPEIKHKNVNTLARRDPMCP